MLPLLILYLLSGTVLLLLAIPLLLQKVPPNRWYGFRVAPAFDNEAVWYATNKYAAKWLIAMAVATMVGALALTLVPQISVDVYAIGCRASFMAIGLPGLFLSWRRAQELVGQRHS